MTHGLFPPDVLVMGGGYKLFGGGVLTLGRSCRGPAGRIPTKSNLLPYPLHEQSVLLPRIPMYPYPPHCSIVSRNTLKHRTSHLIEIMSCLIYIFNPLVLPAFYLNSSPPNPTLPINPPCDILYPTLWFFAG